MTKRSREENIAHCRAYGHRWDSVAIGIAPTYYEEDLECVDCKTKRTDTVSRRGPDKGRTISRKYKYPKDEFWSARQSRAEARLGLLSKKG